MFEAVLLPLPFVATPDNARFEFANDLSELQPRSESE